jgi:hypothetical protein
MMRFIILILLALLAASVYHHAIDAVLRLFGAVMLLRLLTGCFLSALLCWWMGKKAGLNPRLWALCGFFWHGMAVAFALIGAVNAKRRVNMDYVRWNRNAKIAGWWGIALWLSVSAILLSLLLATKGEINPFAVFLSE